MKKIELKISGCEECPFCNYESYYDKSQDSGWDCDNSNTKHTRIINEGPTDRSLRGIQNRKKVEKTLRTQIPEWCPLSDVILKKNTMNNKVDKNKTPVVKKSKDWPAKNKVADFESIVEPLKKALQIAIDKGNKVYDEGIEWTGLKQGGKNSAIVFQPSEALHSINLKYSNEEQNRDVFTEILSIAVQLGMEQGRREIISELKEISFMFNSLTDHQEEIMLLLTNIMGEK